MGGAPYLTMAAGHSPTGSCSCRTSPTGRRRRDGSRYPKFAFVAQGLHPVLIPHEIAGSSPRTRKSLHPRGRRILLMRGIPADPGSGRKRQDRPVTPEVAGSTPVAPQWFADHKDAVRFNPEFATASELRDGRRPSPPKMLRLDLNVLTSRN